MMIRPATSVWGKLTVDERGANLVEYLLLVTLIAIAVLAAVAFLGGGVNSKFSDSGSVLSGID